jgi:glutamate racemase
MTPGTSLTIGVFDSGFGGLTVLRALLSLIPHADYIYIGDTARLPYGSKSHETVARYAVSSAKFLHEQGAGLLVIACNTATALALEDIQHALPIPVIGVVEPGAQAAVSMTHKNSPSPDAPVLVLATTATVQSHAYTRALNALGLESYEKACPLLVPLVEEGWTNHPVTDEVLRIYLTEALTAAPATQTLLLGCTHYPLLEPAIRRTLASLGSPLSIIDSAQATAHKVLAHFTATTANLPGSKPNPDKCTFYATDSIEKFERLGSAFLGQPVHGVRHIDLKE